MRFIPPLVVAALLAAAQQPVDEAKLASARAAHAATAALDDAIDALETRQRARAHERRRLEQRKNEGAAHAAAITNKTDALWAELTKTKDLGDGRGPCDLASAGPDALTWARDALKDAAAASKRLQGDRKAYLEAAQADLELLNRTVYPSLRAERDAIDLNLNDARARQKVLREDHAKSKTAWLRDQAKSFPLSLARSGAANWTAFRGAFNACAPILYGCRCHDDYDLFLCLCPVFFVSSCSLASGGLSHGVLGRHLADAHGLAIDLTRLRLCPRARPLAAPTVEPTAKPPIPPMTPSTRIARRCRAAHMEEPSWLWRLGPADARPRFAAWEADARNRSKALAISLANAYFDVKLWWIDQVDEHCDWRAPGHENCKKAAFAIRNFLELWPCLWKTSLFVWVVKRAWRARAWRWRDAFCVLVLAALALGPGPWGDRKGMRRIGVGVYV